MKNRHGLVVLILIAVSVFFISCGITTYCLPDGISVTSLSQDDLKFQIKGTDDNLSLVKDGPGILLIYTVSNDSVIDYSAIIKDFSTNYSPKSISGKPVFILSTDTGELDTKLSENTFYTFRTESGNFAQAYKFCADLTSIKNHFTEGLNISVIYQDNLYKLINSDTSDTISILSKPKTIEDGNYVHIFATMGIQSTHNNIFNNIYWSNLIYVGCIDENPV